MKKSFLLSFALLGGLIACQKKELIETPTDNTEIVASNIRICGTPEAMKQELIDDPSLAQRLAKIEDFTKEAIKNRSIMRLLPDGTIEIPVVFNVLYRSNAENISDAQLNSQIDVLNEDFGATNPDYNTPNTYSSVRSGDTKIRFVKAATIRKYSSKRSWSTNDAMKSASTGGINPTDPSKNLNFWVVNRLVSNGQTILGYAYYPGISSSIDGVVLGHNYTGRVGTVTAPFNKGRTGTHEVGHYLNLIHIWGDATCGNDQVSDTPLHNTANFGCPSSTHRSTCTGTPLEMTMNYMDYTDDACMYMFSAGQRNRMQAIFVAGGPRNSLAQP